MANSPLLVKSVDGRCLRPSGHPWIEELGAGYLTSRESFVIVKGICCPVAP